MQTIKAITFSSLTKQSLTKTVENANKLLLKKEYRLGEGHCEQEQEEYSLLNEIIKTNICSVLSNIKKSINGEIVEHETAFSLNRDIVNLYGYRDPYKNEILYKLWKQRGNTGSMNDFLDEILKDDSVEWNELYW